MGLVLGFLAIFVLFSLSFLGVAIWMVLKLSSGGLPVRPALPVGPNAELAARQGWSYQPSDPSLVNHWSGEPFIGRGEVKDVLRGVRDGRRFVTFGYEWVDSTGETDLTHRYSVAAVALPAPLPMLQVSPQSSSARLARRLGAQDVEFESGDFNDAFLVSGDDARYVHDVVDPRMMEFLLASPARSQAIRIDGDSALTWVEGPYSAEATMTGLDLLDGFADRLPNQVVPVHATSRPRGYAGTVTGLRPEPTGSDVRRQAIGIGSGLAWTALVYWFFVRGDSFGRVGGGDPMFTVFPWLMLGFGVVTVAWSCVRLVRGIVAIRLNRRDRQRRPPF